MSKKPEMTGATRSSNFNAYMRRYGTLYLLLILPLAFFIIFRYVPMAWILGAFKENNIFKNPWELD